MLSFRNLLFLTLVLAVSHKTAWSKTHEDAPPAKTISEDFEQVEVDPQKVENISISESHQNALIPDALITKFNKENYYHPYRQEINVHGGVVLGVQDSSDDKDLMNVLIGFSYMLPKIESPKWVAGADLSFVGHGHFYLVRRFIYNEKGSFRPFYHYGVMHKYVPEDKFASLSNWDNYLVRLGVGLADIIKPPKSVELELNVAAGTEDVLVMFTYGYSWGF